mmetsp:Transcript_9485/g.20605  ORF Transcript_9485/g.20605 Transcript_9485/m.20605 type:complete len:442 (+) Transcript_9485:381-1706(+)
MFSSLLSAASLLPSSSSPPPPPPGAGAACWICLDGDPDEGGKPIVRDCSCRGEDAGFVHLSCLVSYAKTKTEELLDKAYEKGGEVDLIEPWRKCPVCLQHHQRRVAIDMANSFMSFIDENYPHPDGKVRKLDGFNFMVNTIFVMNYTGSSALREEGKRTAYQMISEIEGIDEVTKERHGDIIDAQKYTAITALAAFAKMDGTKDGYELSLHCQEKIRDWFASKGDEKMAMKAETRIKMTTSDRDGKIDRASHEKLMEGARKSYENAVRKKGPNSPERLQTGIAFAQDLFIAGRGLECERLLDELEAVSHRVFGPDHPLSKGVELGFERYRKRRVGVMSDVGVIEYNALSYNSERGTYNLEGGYPVHGIHEFGMEMFEMTRGMPVICHGLQNAKHLNGKIGDVIRYDAESCHYEVRFEESSLKPASVKEANLRMLFDLPDKQ